MQTQLNINGLSGFYPLGRGNEGRTPWLYQLDFYAAYDLKLSERFTLQLNLNITNLTNNDTARSKYMSYIYETVRLDNQEIKDGFDYAEVVASQGWRRIPGTRWNMITLIPSRPVWESN